MKKAVTLLVAFLMSAIVVMAGPNDGHDRQNSRLRNLFVLKSEKELLGARVEILSANGEVLTAQYLERRKMIIDFGDVQDGTYTIRISKGSETKEFLFVKE